MNKSTQFKPGNPGRPRGTKNKATDNLRGTIKAFLDKNWSKVQKEFDALEPKDKLQFIDRMLAYSLPKLQAVQMDVITDVDRLNDRQVDELFNRIINSKNQSNEQGRKNETSAN